MQNLTLSINPKPRYFSHACCGPWVLRLMTSVAMSSFLDLSQMMLDFFVYPPLQFIIDTIKTDRFWSFERLDLPVQQEPNVCNNRALCLQGLCLLLIDPAIFDPDCLDSILDRCWLMVTNVTRLLLVAASF